MMRTCLPVLLLATRLPVVARLAPGRSVRHVIPCTALTDGRHVIGVHLSAIGYLPTVNALPCVGIEHSLPPRLVGLGAIATGCRVGPVGITTLGA
jgi:hypothetical protein